MTFKIRILSHHSRNPHLRNIILLLSLFVLIAVVIGCTQFGSSGSAEDAAGEIGVAQVEPPLTVGQTNLPAPTRVESEGAKIFAPILMDSSTAVNLSVDLSAMLSQTITTTVFANSVSNSVANPDEVASVDITQNQVITMQAQLPIADTALTITAPSSVTVGEVQSSATPTPTIGTADISTTASLTTNKLVTDALVTDVLVADILITEPLTTRGNDITTGDEENTTNSGVEGGAQNRVDRTVQVPILMYHYLSVPPRDADIYRLDLSVTPNQFSRHLDAMLDGGYTTISLFDLWNHLENGASLPPKPVVITFDDGYLDNYENAFPLLIQRGMTATFFIVTGFIEEGRGGYVNWKMVEEMYDAGMSIESHSTRHFSLKNRDAEFLAFEALRTREIIEAKVGAAPRFVSYPAGEYDQNTIGVFQSANYLMGVTTIQGSTHSNDNYFELRRVRVRGTTDVPQLLALLELDW